MRAYIRRNFGKGNGGYSMPSCEEHPKEYLAYMTKQKNYYTTLPAEVMEAVKAYDGEVVADIKLKKESRKTQLKKCEEYLNEMLDEETEPSQRFVVQTVVEWFSQSETLIREFQVISIAQTLCMKYVPQYQRGFTQRVFERVEVPEDGNLLYNPLSQYKLEKRT